MSQQLGGPGFVRAAPRTSSAATKRGPPGFVLKASDTKLNYDLGHDWGHD